jgi:hypothetical protein
VQVRSQFSLTVVSCWVLLNLFAATPAVLAQAGPDIFVTPIPNAPFRGVVTVERSMVEQNGSALNLKSVREIGRDSQGRIHNESRMLMPASESRTPAVVRIHLYDPVSRTSAYLDPGHKTYSTAIVNHPPATEPPQLLASPEAVRLPQSQFAREEDLGMREIAGLSAHGVRETQTIPAQTSGTGKDVVITDEYWYSDDLRMNLMLRHSDPRVGSVTMTVTQLDRNEPDPAFFEIPSGYTLAAPGKFAGQGAIPQVP